MSLEDSWQAVLLDWCWDVISSQQNVLEHDRMETSVLKLADWLKLDAAFLDDLEFCDAAND